MKKWQKVTTGMISVVGAVALVGANQSVPELSAEQIIPSPNHEQQVIDQAPEQVSKMFAATGGDPSQTRFLGKTSSTSYYGGPTDDDKMCIQIVGEEQGVACTSMTGMAAAGLRIEFPDDSESVWLTPAASVPEKLKHELQEQADAQSRGSEPVAVWEEQSPNFYVKTTNGGEK